jgi:hypothetical protein
MKRWFCLGLLVLCVVAMAFAYNHDKVVGKYLKAHPDTSSEVVVALKEKHFLRGMTWDEAQVVCWGIADRQEERLPGKITLVDEDGVERIKGVLVRGSLTYEMPTVVYNKKNEIVGMTKQAGPTLTGFVPWVTIYFEKGLLVKWEVVDLK